MNSRNCVYTLCVSPSFAVSLDECAGDSHAINGLQEEKSVDEEIHGSAHPESSTTWREVQAFLDGLVASIVADYDWKQAAAAAGDLQLADGSDQESDDASKEYSPSDLEGAATSAVPLSPAGLQASPAPCLYALCYCVALHC